MAMEHGHDHAHDHHITPVAVYMKTFLTLLVLMIMTIVVSYWNLGVMNNVVAMVIAITKATLVVLFFMGVKYGTRLTWLWAALGFIWFLLLFGILSDYYTRPWENIRGWEEAQPMNVMPDKTSHEPTVSSH
jgi:cytochrome c oxidase subunit IV